MDKLKFQALLDGINALLEMGDPDSLRVLSLIDRMLADDFTGTELFTEVEMALNKAEGK